MKRFGVWKTSNGGWAAIDWHTDDIVAFHRDFDSALEYVRAKNNQEKRRR